MDSIIPLLSPKFQASSNLLWLNSPVCVGPGRKPQRRVFSQRDSYALHHEKTCIFVIKQHHNNVRMMSIFFGYKCRVFKGNIEFIQALATKSMQEKKSNISLRKDLTKLFLGSLFGITRHSLVMPNSDPHDTLSILATNL